MPAGGPAAAKTFGALPLKPSKTSKSSVDSINWESHTGATVLRYTENLSYEQISETLQISLGTVKSRLARAHQVLDRELTPVLDRYYIG